MPRRSIYLIALTATLLAVFLQEYNLFNLHGVYPAQQGMLTCTDEYSYLQPALNFLENGVWSGCNNGITCYFQRPPGYGIIFMCCKIISPAHPYFVLKIIQIAAFFCSVVLFQKILQQLNVRRKTQMIFTCIYAFTPCFSGFMYFTITEGITPFLLLLSVYSWLKLTADGSRKNILFYLLVCGFFLLVRPQLLVFILLFNVFFLLKKRYGLFALTCLTFLPLLLWNVRTTNISGKWMGLHPIYSYENNNLFRPSHEKLTNLFRIWEHDGATFHTTVGILAQDTSSQHLKLALQYIPKKYQNSAKPILKSYQQLCFHLFHDFPNKQKITSPFRGELAFNQKIEALTDSLKRCNKQDYYLKTPLRSLKKLVLSSHLSLNVFQVGWRGNILIELLRYWCVLLVAASVCIPFLFIFHRKNLFIQALSLGIMLLIFYLIYVQRMNEERYITPILPLGLLVCAYGFQRMLDKRS